MSKIEEMIRRDAEIEVRQRIRSSMCQLRSLVSDYEYFESCKNGDNSNPKIKIEYKGQIISEASIFEMLDHIQKQIEGVLIEQEVEHKTRDFYEKVKTLPVNNVNNGYVSGLL